MPIDATGVVQDSNRIRNEAQGKPSLLKALSLAIGGFGAASQGQKTPLDKIREQAVMEEELSIRRAGVRQDAFTSGSKALTDLYASGNVSPETVEAIMTQFSSPEIERLTGGVRASLEALNGQLETGRIAEIKSFLPILNANRTAIAAEGYTPDEAFSLYQSNEFIRKKWDDRANSTYLNSAMYKYNAIKDLIARKVIPGPAIDLSNLGELNASLTGEHEPLRISDNEAEILGSNEDAQRRLGMETASERILREAAGVKAEFEADKESTGWTKVTKTEKGQEQDYKKFKDGTLEAFGDPRKIGESSETTKSKWDMTIDGARSYIKSQGYKVGQQLTLTDRTKDPSLAKQMEIAMRSKFTEGAKIPESAIDLLKSDPSDAAKQEFKEAFGEDPEEYLNGRK